MNKRIKELAELAVENTECMMIMEYKNFESKLYENFAQLIIDECVFAVEGTNDRHRREYFAEQIRKHFKE